VLQGTTEPLSPLPRGAVTDRPKNRSQAHAAKASFGAAIDRRINAAGPRSTAVDGRRLFPLAAPRSGGRVPAPMVLHGEEVADGLLAFRDAVEVAHGRGVWRRILSDGKRRKPVDSAMNSDGSRDYSRLRMDPI
jgi:hypothetical protein